MPEDYEDDPEGLEKPPSFFPYEGDRESVQPVDYGEPVEVSVEGVFASDIQGNVQRFVLLSDGDRKLPIIIGGFEATAITLSLEGTTTDRPMTHDLLRNVIERLEATMDRVVIDDLWSTTYYAKIFLKHGDREITIDSRPSDAIALALRFDVPIYVADGILEQATE